jgi:transaldolase/transaldolase/glucose-6-phosphate isomerase
MAMNALRQLNAAGQSVWYDYIRRDLLGDKLATLIERDDLRGITSNPTIFEKALSSGHDYDAALRRELVNGPSRSPRELFYTLAIEDIRNAADQFRPVYERTDGLDGMVSLEVSPDLAHDTEATVREARALRQRLDRPNVMIKVPATKAGIPAVETLISEGINVNVTLLFAVERYREVADAYLRGLERRHAQGGALERIASVASFFVSRVDNAIDPLLADRQPDLAGRIAIANAKLAYRDYQTIVADERFRVLADAGAHPQRLLWASTSTKNPDYPELLYVEQLIGPNTVDTMPPATYTHFAETGTVTETLTCGVDEAERQIAALAELGIDLGEITDRLEAEGVAAFARSFDNLLAALTNRAEELAAA